MIGASCTGRTNRSIPGRVTGPGGYPMPAFPFSLARQTANEISRNCSLSLPFVRCIPEINTKAVILSILICLFFLFIIMLAFISTSLPLILINNNIGHPYEPRDLDHQRQSLSDGKLTYDPKRHLVTTDELLPSSGTAECHTHGNRRTLTEILAAQRTIDTSASNNY